MLVAVTASSRSLVVEEMSQFLFLLSHPREGEHSPHHQVSGCQSGPLVGVEPEGAEGK